MEEDKQVGRIREAISESKAMSLYFTIVEAMAEKTLADPEIELADGMEEFENAIYLIRKAYGV